MYSLIENICDLCDHKKKRISKFLDFPQDVRDFFNDDDQSNYDDGISIQNKNLFEKLSERRPELKFVQPPCELISIL